MVSGCKRHIRRPETIPYFTGDSFFVARKWKRGVGGGRVTKDRTTYSSTCTNDRRLADTFHTVPDTYYCMI